MTRRAIISGGFLLWLDEQTGWLYSGELDVTLNFLCGLNCRSFERDSLGSKIIEIWLAQAHLISMRYQDN